MEKKEMRFRNPYKHVHKRECITEDSVTIPNQCMTVKEIYNRYVVGAPLPPMSQRVKVYDDEDDFTTIPSYLEFDELRTLKNENAQRIDELRDKIERKNAPEVSSGASDAQPENG